MMWYVDLFTVLFIKHLKKKLYVQVFPSAPVHVKRCSQIARVHGYVQVPVSNQPCPDWIPAIKG